jgi:predicted ATPase
VLDRASQELGAKDSLARHIGERSLLLLLDNFEHVVDAADDVAGLLAECPNLTVVVTSRALLRLPAEQAYPVEPLEPADANELFLARVRASTPSFEATPTVSAICERLEHLPLALELAAARVRVLSPAQLLERLSARLALLRGDRGLDPRQQTLRATVEWSFDLLDPAEQRLFTRLAVFRGGWTLEAVEEVADADLDTLQSLVEQSLIGRTRERFRMLETIREYAEEQLAAAPDAETLRHRHAGHYLRLAEAVRQANRAGEPGGAARSEQFAEELDNVRAAIAHLLAAGDRDAVLRLAGATLDNLWARGLVLEPYRWLADTLAADDGSDPAVRADGLGMAAFGAFTSGDRPAARSYADASLALASALGDKRQQEWSLRVLAMADEDPSERIRLLHECEALLRDLGDEQGLGWVAYMLADVAVGMGSFDAAIEACEEAITIFGRLGMQFETANARSGLGLALVYAGREADAAAVLDETLREAVELNAMPMIAECLVSVAALRGETDPALASRLVAAATALGSELSLQLEPSWQRLADRVRTSARERLGDRYDAEWASGELLTRDEAVALALRSV